MLNLTYDYMAQSVPSLGLVLMAEGTTWHILIAVDLAMHMYT